MFGLRAVKGELPELEFHQVTIDGRAQVPRRPSRIACLPEHRDETHEPLLEEGLR